MLFALCGCSGDKLPDETGVIVRIDAERLTKGQLADVNFRLYRYIDRHWEIVLGKKIASMQLIQQPYLQKVARIVSKSFLTRETITLFL